MASEREPTYCSYKRPALYSAALRTPRALASRQRGGVGHARDLGQFDESCPRAFFAEFWCRLKKFGFGSRARAIFLAYQYVLSGHLRCPSTVCQPSQVKTSMGSPRSPKSPKTHKARFRMPWDYRKKTGLHVYAVLHGRRLCAADEQQGQAQRARDARGAAVPRRRVPRARRAPAERRRRRSSRTCSRSRRARSAASAPGCV